MIAEKLEKRESVIAKENFITRKREYKRALKICLNCLCLVCGGVQNGKCLALFIWGRLLHSSASCATCLNI